MSGPSPVVASWELALRLKQQREQLGIEVKTITQALGFTRNYWSAVENERKILSQEALARVVDLFEFDDEEKAELLALRTAARSEDGGRTQSSSMPPSSACSAWNRALGVSATTRAYSFPGCYRP